jgi:hypothetical protein
VELELLNFASQTAYPAEQCHQVEHNLGLRNVVLQGLKA